MATNNFAVSTGSNSFSSSNSAYCSEYMVVLGVVFPVYTNRNGGAKWHGRKDQGEHEGTGERENPGEKRRERKPGKEFCFVLVDVAWCSQCKQESRQPRIERTERTTLLTKGSMFMMGSGSCGYSGRCMGLFCWSAIIDVLCCWHKRSVTPEIFINLCGRSCVSIAFVDALFPIGIPIGILAHRATGFCCMAWMSVFFFFWTSPLTNAKTSPFLGRCVLKRLAYLCPPLKKDIGYCPHKR